MPRIKITHGSGNVFADIGIGDASQVFSKAEIVSAINQSVRDLGLTTSEAAQVLGVDKIRVTDMQRGRLDLFSLGDLAKYARRFL